MAVLAASSKLRRTICPRRNRPQTELPQAFVGFRLQLDFVRDGMGSVTTDRLEQAQEDDGAIRRPAAQDNLFAKLVSPLQFRVLYKESLIAVPAGNFHATLVRTRVFGA
jgi:hypothetical protein